MSQKSTIASPDSIVPTSPFSTHLGDNFSNSSSISVNQSHNSPDENSNSPILITQATYKKPTTKHVTQLSTSSPAGIAVANQVTPQRLAALLLTTGPLAIRHITSNLTIQINGFEKLSLSKQRRLIMNALNQGFQEGSIVFQKIGWGQWSAKKVPIEDFIKERDSLKISNAKVKDDEGAAAPTGGANSKSINAVNAANARRESITKNRYETDQHDKLLNSRRHGNGATLLSKSQPISSTGGMVNDFAIMSDDEDEDAIISSTSDFYDEDSDSESSSDLSHHRQAQLFKLEDEERIPSLKLSTRSHNISPNSTSSAASRRSSFNARPTGGISKPPKYLKHRSNSMTPTSPELRYYSTSAAAAATGNYSHNNGSHINIVNAPNGTDSSKVPSHSKINSRRHSSIRSTLSIDQELLQQQHSNSNNGNSNENQGHLDDDTDEEDWESIGAIKLLRSLKNGSTNTNGHGQLTSLNTVGSSSQINVRQQLSPSPGTSTSGGVAGGIQGRDEEDAASALLNLTRRASHTAV